MKKKYIFIMLVVWMGIIYMFSSQTYEEQSLSYILANFRGTPVEQLLQRVHFYYAGSEISIYAIGVEGVLEFFIRKAAHFGIFFVLGFLTYAFFRNKWNGSLMTFAVSFMFVVLYACLDEFHQKLTGGRTPLLQDVILDSVGGLCGIVALVLYFLYKRKM
ncbi:VanZ family protein [Bacillus sp. AGMB 02131]|uniref:VanZ family protein n=1 Tax=Peribacillus faecalis TaxID=2772559 RepID=A0A927CXY1_9BACI|nr:VanZ family protein [Peribacillus faecalis]MBD3108747.1 VanZ family protein [Peribacillus faecalis]